MDINGKKFSLEAILSIIHNVKEPFTNLREINELLTFLIGRKTIGKADIALLRASRVSIHYLYPELLNSNLSVAVANDLEKRIAWLERQKELFGEELLLFPVKERLLNPSPIIAQRRDMAQTSIEVELGVVLSIVNNKQYTDGSLIIQTIDKLVGTPIDSKNYLKCAKAVRLSILYTYPELLNLETTKLSVTHAPKWIEAQQQKYGQKMVLYPVPPRILTHVLDFDEHMKTI